MHLLTNQEKICKLTSSHMTKFKWNCVYIKYDNITQNCCHYYIVYRNKSAYADIQWHDGDIWNSNSKKRVDTAKLVGFDFILSKLITRIINFVKNVIQIINHV